MKYYLFLLLSIFSLNTTAQTVEKYYDWQWKPCKPNEARFYAQIISTDSGYVRKDYFIHERFLQMSGKYKDANCEIHHGYFHYFHANRSLESKGQYIDGKKHGTWISYHSNGNMSDSTVYDHGAITGTSMAWHPNGYNADSTTYNADGSGVSVTWFDNGAPSSAGLFLPGGKPNGKWIFYHNNGKPAAVETYAGGTLTNKVYFDETGAEKPDTTNRDTRAVFAGGDQNWHRYMLKHAYFPKGFELVNGDKAVVVISFVINEEGKVTDAFVSTPFYPEFDKIALKAVVNSPKWKPAISHNRKVKAWRRQPVTFAQEEE